jgi:hypothetical protein
VYALNANQKATDEKVTGAIGRIDRIASALPDVRIRIANEETAKPIRAAIVVADPVKNKAGEWVVAIHLIDVAGSSARRTGSRSQALTTRPQPL